MHLSRKLAYQRFLKVIFLLTNVPFLIINVVDYEYHKFIGQRSTLNLLDMGADIPNQIGQLSFHYWYLAAISVLFILTSVHYFFATVALPASDGESEPAGIRATGPATCDLIIVVTLADHWRQRRMATTAFDHRPRRSGDRESLSQLALNSTYTLINSQS